MLYDYILCLEVSRQNLSVFILFFVKKYSNSVPLDLDLMDLITPLRPYIFTLPPLPLTLAPVGTFPPPHHLRRRQGPSAPPSTARLSPSAPTIAPASLPLPFFLLSSKLPTRPSSSSSLVRGPYTALLPPLRRLPPSDLPRSLAAS